jgi:hypothetical protein
MSVNDAPVDRSRVDEHGWLRTTRGLGMKSVSLGLPDRRVRMRTEGVVNLGDPRARYLAVIADDRGPMPDGFLVELMWPGYPFPQSGATLVTCEDHVCGILVSIDGELGELDLRP